VCLLCGLVAVSALADADLLVFTDSTNNRFVEPGTTATFTVFVRNFGPDAATNLRLRLPLPPQSKFVSVTTKGGWNCSGTDAEVNCTLATLAVNQPGQDATSVTATAVLSSDPNGQQSHDAATVTADTPDSKTFNNESTLQTTIYRMLIVTSTADSGPDSLRGKIDESNTRCGGEVPCKIKFDLPENSTIEPITPLPAIRAQWLRIDGSRDIAGDRRVELSGARLTSGNGLEIRSAGIPSSPMLLEIFGLAINRFADYGVATIGNGDANVTLEGMFVGTDVTGTIARPNGRGLGLFAPRMMITMRHNVISGNVHSGIFDAISLATWLHNSLIGVGTDLRPLGNGNSGVFIFRGGIDIGSCTIANNGQFGISIARQVDRASIGGSNIYSNGFQGIDWGLDGPSSGSPARFPDPPSIADAVYDSAKNETVITGTIDSASIFGRPLMYVDVFANSNGGRQGERFLTRVVVNGLNFTARAKGDLRGQIITSTLNVGPYLDSVPTLTSEFSEGVTAH